MGLKKTQNGLLSATGLNFAKRTNFDLFFAGEIFKNSALPFLPKKNQS